MGFQIQKIRGGMKRARHQIDTSSHGPAAFYRVRQLW